MKHAVALVGEAWGEYEARERAPFVGPSGQELTRMLAEAGIHRADCFLTNVFNLRPTNNDIETLCGGKANALPGYPALVKGKYVRAEYGRELERLGDDLLAINPNVVVALGNTPLWALCGKTGISKIRGTTLASTHTVAGYKTLPTFHPAAIMRQWELRPIAVVDLMKANKESAYAEIRRPRREIWIEPSIADLWAFKTAHIDGCGILSTDIETAGNQITCVGFAPNPRVSIVIPFVDPRRKGRSYWTTEADERAAWDFVAGLLSDPNIPKLFQNGLYDIAFIWRTTGIKVRGATHDTMLLHHALQPEMLKGLGFLASVYADEGAWKDMRKHSTTIKRDD